MRNTYLALLCGVALGTPLLAVSSGQAEIMYAVDLQFNNSQFSTIDPVTGVQTNIGSTGVIRNQSLAATPSGVLYSMGGPQAPLNNRNTLLTIDPVTGAGNVLGAVTYDINAPFNTPVGLAADATGMLYASAARSASGTPFGLYKINPATLTGTFIGTTSDTLQSLDFAPDGTLYGWNIGSGLVKVNATTGATTNVSSTVYTNPIVGLAFASDGTLWSSETSGQLSTIDLLTGAPTVRFGTGIVGDLRGIEFLTPVPVPAALWLFGSGLAAMVGFARRHMNRQVL